MKKQQAVNDPIEWTMIKGGNIEEGVYVTDNSNPLAQAWIVKYNAQQVTLVRNENLPGEYRYKVWMVANNEPWNNGSEAWTARRAIVNQAECELADLINLSNGYKWQAENLIKKGYDEELIRHAVAVIPTPAPYTEENTDGWE